MRQELKQILEEEFKLGFKTNDNNISMIDLKRVGKIVRSMYIDMSKIMKKYNNYIINNNNIKDPHMDLEEYGSDGINSLGILFFNIEFAHWNDSDQSKYDKACDELMSIEKDMAILFKNKYKFIQNNKKGYDYKSVYMKNNKVLYSIESEGDKCDDRIWSLNIYAPNIKEYSNVKYHDIGFKI